MDKKFVSPRNSFAEAGTHNVTVFGDKIFMEAVVWGLDPIGLVTLEE